MTDLFNKLSSDRGIRTGVVAVLSILTLFLLASTLGVLKNMGRPGGPATDTITVTADGQATKAPDVAKVSFTVQNSAPAVSDAQEKTTAQSNAAIDYVKGKGIEEKDIKTLSYSISPQYSYSVCPAGVYCPSNQKITGYEVSQTVQVTVRDLKSVGDILAGLGKLEVQGISGPNFALDDATAGYDAARADAIHKAKEQAKELSRQLGVRLGKVVNFSESSGGIAYPMAYGLGVSERSMDTKSATPTVPTGENTYNASVSITYEIR
jgi:uncharacterized protein